MWPWLLGLGALVAVVTGGWFLYDNVQNQINNSKPLRVQQYTGIIESRAVDLIINDGFEPNVRRLPNGTQPVGIVFEQSPAEGTGLERGGMVTILVSTGKKTVTVPDVVGKQLTEAVATLTKAGLVAKSVGVPSDKPSGTVTGAGSGSPERRSSRTRASESTTPPARNRSQYPTSSVSTTRLPCSSSRPPGFAVARTDVDNTQPANVVVSQVPSGSSTAAKGSTVNLSVSNGPQTTPLPDVTGQTEANAQASLTAAGFAVSVTPQDTDVPTFDGVVISQDPPGNTQQDPKTIVTLFVGSYVPPVTTSTPIDDVDHHDTTAP